MCDSPLSLDTTAFFVQRYESFAPDFETLLPEHLPRSCLRSGAQHGNQHFVFRSVSNHMGVNLVIDVMGKGLALCVVK